MSMAFGGVVSKRCFSASAQRRLNDVVIVGAARTPMGSFRGWEHICHGYHNFIIIHVAYLRTIQKSVSSSLLQDTQDDSCASAWSSCHWGGVEASQGGEGVCPRGLHGICLASWDGSGSRQTSCTLCRTTRYFSQGQALVLVPCSFFGGLTRKPVFDGWIVSLFLSWL